MVSNVQNMRPLQLSIDESRHLTLEESDPSAQFLSRLRTLA
jgi:hypothetical protein